MAYNLQDKGRLDSSQQAQVLERISDFHRANAERLDAGERPASANSLIRELRGDGAGYNRQNMLDDIRRSEVSYRASDIPAMTRAERFYENVLEPIRKEYGVNQDEALKIWSRIRDEDFSNLERAEWDAEMWDIYKGG